MSVELEPARWPGGPKICPSVNRLAFGSKAELDAFYEALPAVNLVRSWICTSCAHWHGEGKARAPSGATSGSSRR